MLFRREDNFFTRYKFNGKKRILVGFALEDRAVRFRAERKLIEKDLDMIVANSPTAISVDRSDFQIKTVDSSWIKIENATKAAAAKKIVRLVEELDQARLSRSTHSVRCRLKAKAHD